MCGSEHIYVSGIYLCVWKYVYVSGGVHVPWHVCGGWRTTLDVGSRLPPCLRQAFLSTAVYLRLVHLWDPAGSCFGFPSCLRSTGIPALYCLALLCVGSCHLLQAHSCVVSPWPMESSSQPKKTIIFKAKFVISYPCKSESNVKGITLYIT